MSETRLRLARWQTRRRIKAYDDKYLMTLKDLRDYVIIMTLLVS